MSDAEQPTYKGTGAAWLEQRIVTDAERRYDTERRKWWERAMREYIINGNLMVRTEDVAFANGTEWDSFPDAPRPWYGTPRIRVRNYKPRASR